VTASFSEPRIWTRRTASTIIAMMVALQKHWPIPSVAAANDSNPVSGSVSASDGRAFTSPVDYLSHGPESAYEYTSTRVDEGGQFHFGELKPA
jgi:hypothetical protein